MSLMSGTIKFKFCSLYLWKHSEGFALQKTSSKLDLRFQRYEQFFVAENNKIQKEFHTLILDVSQNQYSRHTTHSAWSPHICSCSTKVFHFGHNEYTENSNLIARVVCSLWPPEILPKSPSFALSCHVASELHVYDIIILWEKGLWGYKSLLRVTLMYCQILPYIHLREILITW